MGLLSGAISSAIKNATSAAKTAASSVTSKTSSSSSSSSTKNTSTSTASSNTATSTGKTVQVQSNGKAPAGLSVGDKVVTGGGTYQITGVNADGSYTSTKVSNVTTSSGSTGSTSASSANTASGATQYVSTYTDQQEAIKAQMQANSNAWYNATTQEEKDRLHAANVALAAQLGGNVQYDSSTGRWYGSSDAPTAEDTYQFMTEEEYPTTTESYTPTDQSDYLKQMAAAYLAQQQEALTQAYNENVTSLQTEQDKLAAQYDAARNSESASNALARKQFQETAAAYGLNSGTSGQAELSFANQRLSDLSDLQAAEAAANQEVERQRTLLSQQYQSAMAEAVAENNYELFQQLYNEAVRVDEATQAQQQFNASLALQQYQTALEQYNTDRTYNYQTTQDSLSDSLASAKLLAAAGDYSAYGDIYGWSDATVQKMNQLWQAAQTSSSKAASYSARASSTAANGSEASGTSQTSGASGARTATEATGRRIGTGTQTADSDTGMSESNFRRMMTTLGVMLAQGRADTARSGAENTWSSLSTSQKSELQALFLRYGYRLKS